MEPPLEPGEQVRRGRLPRGLIGPPAVAAELVLDLTPDPLGAEPRAEHDEVQREEHDRVDGGSPDIGIGVAHQGTPKAHIERPLQLAVDVVRRNTFLHANRR
jgi:hypothetical protein